MGDFVFSSKTFLDKEPGKENDALNVTKLSFCWPVGLLFYIEGLLYSYICLRNLADAYLATTVTATE